jgi:hypothetical protein
MGTINDLPALLAMQLSLHKAGARAGLEYGHLRRTYDTNHQV